MKSGQLHLRVTAEEKALVEAKAAAVALPVSKYLLKLVREHDLRHRYDEDAAYQLQRIGRNLNQVVRRLHQGDFSEAVRDGLGRCLALLEEELARLGAGRDGGDGRAAGNDEPAAEDAAEGARPSAR